MEKKTGHRAQGTGVRKPERSQSEAAAEVVTAPEIRASKGTRRLVMVTAVDEPSARLADLAGVDIVLVGDSLGMAALGRPDTLSVTLDEMIHHTRAAAAGAKRALLVADMPFGSYQASVADAVRSACRLVAEGGARAVKLEGPRCDETAAITAAGIPVMGHLGLTPQAVHRLGGYRVQGRGVEEALRLVEQARALERAGAFLLVLEAIPAPLAAAVTRRVGIPTIGIGAGPACDGQVLVLADLLGLSDAPAPRFVRRYADLGRVVRDAIAAFAGDVRAGRYPAPDETYPSPPGLAAALAKHLGDD
ncbi:MAG: 3-methyl-2-oxobutanoate hydroxymethyltransferase [Acidobacteria bacterium 37-71-11]|nr:MAG: 3-methyl-2-oxobutanoate hydroxymethyltransferase [Acidobacteria bacterium 37-71-11]HQT93744.1 3-methyl-2-oxobutanoate hydroxymethyltransferase [Thermoanaerobaculaceae bacterium]